MQGIDTLVTRFVRLAHNYRNYQKPETGFRRHLSANLVLPHD